ncbi:phosphatase PAP2 family protein [Thermus tengchongensis]|uniref:phosphatase PAP2 family protein n=1 Tax=Thermus tengchongensis TaxID=1214928 RepID=UPI000A97626F|nr:phosphatase PAP2 family protein [Thermus tengchongensis]
MKALRWREMWASLVPLALWGGLFAALLLFLALAEDVYEKEGFAFDPPVLAFFHDLRSAALDPLARALTASASPPAMAGAALAVLGLGYALRLPWPRFLLGFGGAMLFTFAAKLFFARPRPHLFPPLALEHDYGFPSGHTVASLALVLGLYFLLRERYPKAARWALALGLPWALLVGLSRLYLQVHYPSDVLAGWGLSAAWSLFVGLWGRSPRRG